MIKFLFQPSYFTTIDLVMFQRIKFLTNARMKLIIENLDTRTEFYNFIDKSYAVAVVSFREIFISLRYRVK